MNIYKIPYATLKVIERRLNERLPYRVDIFNPCQLRMSWVRDRVQVALNYKAFYGDDYEPIR